jgi:hypothetical protein
MTKAGIQAIRRLFGDVVCSVAGGADAATLDLSAGLMDRVHDGADTLLKLRRYPEEQLRYVSELPFDVRLVLCMWVMDCDLADKLAQRALT